MARQIKRNRKPTRGGRIALRAFAALLLALALLAGVSALNATVVRVRRATVAVEGLPPSFEGKKLLFAADIDLCGLNTAEKSAALFRSLQALEPDILLLGGDYTSTSVFDALNGANGRVSGAEKRLRARTDFFHYISGFSAPLGKYAIAAPEDAEPEALAALMRQSGVEPLFNGRAELRLGGDALWIAGVSADTGLGSLGGSFRRDDCVVAAAWGPAAFPAMVTSEASDGGRWCDLVLSGHTHGGQIRLFGRSVLSLSRLERQHMQGWMTENGVPFLVSSGVGCEGANLRLGSAAEVWLLTLTAKAAREPG